MVFEIIRLTDWLDFYLTKLDIKLVKFRLVLLFVKVN